MDLMLTDAPVYTAGGGFPWGLLIIGGIVYLLWTKGVFDGRGRFGNGPRNGGYGGGFGPGPVAGYGQTQMTEAPGYGAGYNDQRAAFEEWHRQAHEAGVAHHQESAAPQAPVAPQAPPEAEAPTTGSHDLPRQV